MTLRVHLYMPPDHRVAASLTTGFRRHGIDPVLKEAPSACDLAVVWGYPSKLPHPYRRLLVLERGYIGKRKRWISMGYDGLNGLADFCIGKQGMPSDRYERWVKPFVQEWGHGQSNVQYVLIIGQVPGDANLRGLDPHKWCFDTARRVRDSGLPVMIRWHPKSRERPPSEFPVMRDGIKFRDAIKEAASVVVFNSNAAVDAVLAGVPAVTLDAGSMAYSVTSHDPTCIAHTFDRTQWMNDLAYSQWCIDGVRHVNEVERGDWWEHLHVGMQ